MAETFTDKFKLSKRDTGDLNWGQGSNANLDALDQHIQQALLRPPRTLTATLGSGGVGANLAGNTAYFYKITAVNAAGETTEGKVPSTVEAQVTQPASPLPVILQWETVKGATGYKIYKATSSGQEKFLASVSGESTSIYTDDGNTATNPSISVPTSNLAKTSVSRIIAGTNVTISPTDGTGDVTVNAASGTPSDASDTVKGVTKLSVAPASPTDPIAVGDNDPRNTNPRPPSGTAGGDLSGSYPNPAVAKVSGVSVPASPSVGQVLTATSPTAAAWQTPAGGGGYATVVVAAPTGVAATDTANIQNALNSAGVGTVILREGLYLVNTTITLKNRVTLRGQGRGEYGQGAPTTIKCDNAMGDVALFDDQGQNHYDVVLEDFSIDFNGYSRAARSGSYDMRLVGLRTRLARIALANTAGLSGPIYIASSNINEQDSPLIVDCIFVQGKAINSWFAFLQGKVRNCTFISGTASGGYQSSLVTFGSATTVVGCVFRHNTDYSTGVSGSTVSVNTSYFNGRSGVSITGCVFIQEANTSTRAIQVEDSGAGSVTITGNYASTGTNCGSIGVRNAGGTGKVTITGNAGFNGYSGGSQAGNDGQTALNSGAAAGGDLSGTLPSPAVSKVNGVSVPASPSAGQVLTATGPTAAAWQTPTAGGVNTGDNPILGTGADGAVTISANTTLPATNRYGFSPTSSENYGFGVAVKNYTSLTIDAGATLTVAARASGDASGVIGLIIRCQGTVTINGKIDVNGKGAQVNTGVVNPTSVNSPSLLYNAVPSTLIFPTVQGFGGPTGGVNPGSSITGSGGGGGGNSGAYQGGSGGPAISANALAALLAQSLADWGESFFLCGSSGGCGGGGSNQPGNGGGFVLIFANSIVIGSTGQILANGTGGNPGGTSMGSQGGGGGGAGGVIMLAYKSLTNSGTLQANGGNGGQGGALASWGIGGTNTTINGQPTAGTSGGSASPGGSGGGGSGGVILGMVIP